jgi:hypothetical protein
VVADAVAQSESGATNKPDPAATQQQQPVANSEVGFDARSAILGRLLQQNAVRLDVADSLIADATGRTGAHAYQWLRAHQQTACTDCHQNAHAHAQNPVQLHAAVAWRSLGSQWIGIDTVAAEEPLRSQLKLPEGQGLLVTFVHAESPGAKAGIKPHDVLLAADQAPLGTNEQFQGVVNQSGDKALKFTAISGGKSTTYEVVPDRQTVFLSVNPIVEQTKSIYRIGVRTAGIEDALRAQLNLTDGTGILVSEVIAETPAERAGFHLHDVLISANDQVLKEVNDLRNYLQETGGKAVTIKLIRAGKTLRIEVTPELHVEPQPLAPVLWRDMDFAGKSDLYVVRSAIREELLNNYSRIDLTRRYQEIQLPVTDDSIGQVDRDLKNLVEQSKQLTAAIDQLSRDLERLQKAKP